MKATTYMQGLATSRCVEERKVFELSSFDGARLLEQSRKSIAIQVSVEEKPVLIVSSCGFAFFHLAAYFGLVLGKQYFACRLVVRMPRIFRQKRSHCSSSCFALSSGTFNCKHKERGKKKSEDCKRGKKKIIINRSCVAPVKSEGWCGGRKV